MGWAAVIVALVARTGPPHRLTVQVRPDLSRTADVVPTAVVRGAQLLVAGAALSAGVRRSGGGRASAARSPRPVDRSA